MLRSKNGAATLGSLRRPFLMSSFARTTTSPLPAEMRRLSSRAIKLRLDKSMATNSMKTWSPIHGIVFRDEPRAGLGVARSLSTATPRDDGQSGNDGLVLSSALPSAPEAPAVAVEKNIQLSELVDGPESTARINAEADLKYDEIDGVLYEDDLSEPAANAIEEELQSGVRGDQIPEEAVTVPVNGEPNPELEPELEPDTEEPIPEDPEQNELPLSASAYKMTEELFRKAKEAAPESPESYWSYNLYRGPELEGTPQKVKVHYCRNKNTTEETIKKHFLGKKVLGFDIEWKMQARYSDGARKNVSLIQLATEERIGLFHIAMYPENKFVRNKSQSLSNKTDLVAPSLKKLMEDSEVTKVGVCIRGDCTRLKTHLDIHSVSVMELSHLYRLVKFSKSKEYGQVNKRTVALAKQVQDCLHLPMFKGDVRTSDWSKPLLIDQIVYAASDSYAGLQVYNSLELQREALDPTPPRPYHADEDKPIKLAEGVVIPADDVAAEASTSKRKSTKRTPAVPIPLPLDPLGEHLAPHQPDLWINTQTKTASNSKSNPKPSRVVRRSPAVLAAEVLSEIHRNENPTSKTLKSSLRAYFLWYHNPSLSLSDMAALLKEPPLQTSTVATYILEALKGKDNLPFEKERLKEVLDFFPKSVAWDRYRRLVMVVDGATEVEVKA